jgi:hypothetical protein
MPVWPGALEDEGWPAHRVTMSILAAISSPTNRLKTQVGATMFAARGATALRTFSRRTWPTGPPRRPAGTVSPVPVQMWTGLA